VCFPHHLATLLEFLFERGSHEMTTKVGQEKGKRKKSLKVTFQFASLEKKRNC